MMFLFFFFKNLFIYWGESAEHTRVHGGGEKAGAGGEGQREKKKQTLC